MRKTLPSLAALLLLTAGSLRAEPYAAYVLLAESPTGATVPFARVIVDGGPGWFYFLDASSDLSGGKQLACPSQDGEGPALPHLQLVEPQVLHLGDVAGHMHRFEALSFAAPSHRPPTLVVGNSGIAEDPEPPVGAFAQTVDGAPALGFSLAQFGYLELTRDSRGEWNGAVVAMSPTDWSPFLAPCGVSFGDQALCVKPLPTSAQ